MIADDHANGVAYVSGAFVPADTENILFEKQRRQAALPPQDATIGFTAPITRGGTITDWIYHFLVGFYLPKFFLYDCS